MTFSPLVELALIFLRLGATSFGGPAVHIAQMEEEFVRRRKWLTEEEFLDLLGATNLIPGPNSTEMAIHIGRKRAGTKGLIIAGICFIWPAMLIVLACAMIYERYGQVPTAQGILYGIKPVIIAVVFQAVFNLSKKFLKSPSRLGIAVIAGALSFIGWPEIGLLLCGGTLLALLTRFKAGPTSSLAALAFFTGSSLRPRILWAAASGATSVASLPPGLAQIFFFFLKIGSVLYGSGYVLLAFLQRGLVEQNGWITSTQLLDATAVGQFTPGPVFTTATFIGYLLNGFSGAGVATLGIFLPSFVFVAFSAKLIPKIRSSPLASAFLDGVNAVSLGLMTAVGFLLVSNALIDLPTIILAVASTFLLVRFQVNSLWPMAAGALFGLIYI